jgi:lanthionine synthetase-like protein
VIFRATEHTPLAGGPWDERLARYAIADILDETITAGPPDEAGVYAGVAGEVYALRFLGKQVDWELGAGEGPGFADGEVGIALASGDRGRFRAAAPACTESPWNELLYGAGGALVAASLLGEDDVAREAIRRLWSTWTFDSNLRACIWTQEYDNRRVQFLGMAHGVAGNAYALLRAASLQSREHQTELMHRLVETLERTALRDGNLVNWPPVAGETAADQIRVQWCHGAPGVVCALAGAPAQHNLNALLLAAGELVWEAGPLRGGAGLCHGTAGNGWAFLKLDQRTGDRKWLERARRFAMHAIEQRKGERGLWTGDLGVALYLRACIDADDRWPLLDVS